MDTYEIQKPHGNRSFNFVVGRKKPQFADHRANRVKGDADN